EVVARGVELGIQLFEVRSRCDARRAKYCAFEKVPGVRFRVERRGADACYWRSSACCFSASSGITASVSSFVAARTTGDATPASKASRQVAAQTHHRSPGLRPENPDSGTGVIRSLPRLRAKRRNSAVTSAHT